MEYGLIGEKLGHSYSKLIQEKLLDNYTYDLNPVAKSDLDNFMKQKDFKAINVTIPYKKKVIPYLDEIDECAKSIGAVNTIVNKAGKLYGYNTDYLGFAYMLKKHQITITNKKVLVIGNGGASQAIQGVIRDNKPSKMIISDIAISENVVDIKEVYQNHLDAQVIINTSPVGMYPHVDHSAIELDKFDQLEACVDVIYNPFNTKFILEGKNKHVKAISGLEMLVAQAKYALEFFKDIKIDDQQIDKIYHEILMETTNLVISNDHDGQALKASRLLGKRVIDTKAEIVKTKDISIKEYLQKYGEEKLNESEEEIILNHCLENNICIIVTNKALENTTNKTNLIRNGIIIDGLNKSSEQLIQEYKDNINQL